MGGGALDFLVFPSRRPSAVDEDSALRLTDAIVHHGQGVGFSSPGNVALHPFLHPSIRLSSIALDFMRPATRDPDRVVSDRRETAATSQAYLEAQRQFMAMAGALPVR